MIGKLKGVIESYGEDTVIVDVNGVGYEVHCSARTMQELPGIGQPATLSIETHVREDQIRLFGFVTEIERELVSIDPGYAEVSPTARLDSFLTDEAYSFVELNGESPAGIAYADAAYEIFSSLPVMKRFNERYHVRPQFGRHLLLEVLLRAHAEFLGHKPERAPQIAMKR